MIIKVFDSETQYTVGNVSVVDGEEYYKEDLEELLPANLNKEEYLMLF